jgi:hypothetical protein
LLVQKLGTPDDALAQDIDDAEDVVPDEQLALMKRSQEVSKRMANQPAVAMSPLDPPSSRQRPYRTSSSAIDAPYEG